MVSMCSHVVCFKHICPNILIKPSYSGNSCSRRTPSHLPICRLSGNYFLIINMITILDAVRPIFLYSITFACDFVPQPFQGIIIFIDYSFFHRDYCIISYSNMFGAGESTAFCYVTEPNSLILPKRF